MVLFFLLHSVQLEFFFQGRVFRIKSLLFALVQNSRDYSFEVYAFLEIDRKVILFLFVLEQNCGNYFSKFMYRRSREIFANL